jgi:hypothetical protein
MSKTDWTPEGQPADEAGSLSATGMFLSAFGKEVDQPQKQSENSLVQPVVSLEGKQAQWPAEAGLSPSPFPSPAVPSAVGSTQAPPGEFTKMFRTTESPAAPPQVPAIKLPIPAAEPKAPPSSAPGEFTRIFVKSADPIPAPARAISDPPHAVPAAPASPRLKGFSSGASDSASAEGSFTQFFQASPAAPAPAPRVQAYSPPTPLPAAPVEEIKWPRQPDVRASESQGSAGSGPSSVTGLIASLASTGQHPVNTKPQTFEPLPSFSPAPPAEPSTVEPGSVTRLIQRLSEPARVAPAAGPPPIAAAAPAPAIESGPGEFTRMISMSPAAGASSASVRPAPAAPAAAPLFAAPMAKPAMAMPPVAMPPAPAPLPVAAPPPMQAPKIVPPPMPAPKIAPPAVAAPTSKFQEMVPILLVVNTFLLLVLIVLVIFALKAK